MKKRLFDITIATVALLISAPFIGVAAIGIIVTSPGPVFYRAQRTGRDGSLFQMYKLRTMHISSNEKSSITSPGDDRIFPFGNMIRRMKVDELPQFWNILTGSMSLVGPRPEAPKIVDEYYTDWMRETLNVRPGVTSPGAIYNYLMAETLIDEGDPEGSYAANLLMPKLALERAYQDRANFVSDIGYVVLTAKAVVAHFIGWTVVLPAVDVNSARRWAPHGPYTNDIK